MAYSKENKARGEAPPSYEDASGLIPVVEDPIPVARGPIPDSEGLIPVTRGPIPDAEGLIPVVEDSIPTADSPFNFPPAGEPPAYSAWAANTSDPRPIAIPQIKADPTSPFLEAFPPSLSRHGITQDTWLGFVKTLSGFLAATVSQKAISHAADMAQHVGNVPKQFGKETMEHIKASGRNIKETAKSGNVVGAAVHVVGATVGISVATALRAVGAAVTLPFAAINAVGREPKTPKERAVAYIAAANIKWLHRAGLEAHLLDTSELSEALRVSSDELLNIARAAREMDAEAQLAALGAYLAELHVRVPGPLNLGAGTFWLAVTERDVNEEDVSESIGKGKGRERRDKRRSKHA
ncbi:hypothetical protein F5Y11DRAFT_205845 [Daldinia sp. FL1419]|nr:hypothetical protein F5Y11DRAFT_205845 [Daldinia sp. FL1419]